MEENKEIAEVETNKNAKELTKEDLLAQASELSANTNLNEALRQAHNLKKKWQRMNNGEESMYDRDLNDQFYAFIAGVEAQEASIQAEVAEKKKEIIAKAKEVKNNSKFNEASKQMDALMEEWKSAGRGNKIQDDELWEEFRTIRNDFFAKRKAYYEELRENFKIATAKKEELIARAIEANNLENIKELNAEMAKLMEEWKAIGSASREHEEDLWNRFNEERKKAFTKTKAHYNALSEEFGKRTEAKKELIAQAKKNLAISSFTKEEEEEMKQLRAKWKAIGNAGRQNEEKLWEEFSQTMQLYFDHLYDDRNFHF